MGPPLFVAVCTNRAPAAIGATVEAVGEQVRAAGADGLLVTSGVGDGGHAALAVVAEVAGLRILREQQPGLAIARNRALAEVPEGGVLALIDDDAIPAPDWLERLGDRWAKAPSEVACIGGAILPRWLEPPPRWMSERVHIVFSLLDRGGVVKDLRPGWEDAWGANISFRADALREIGGFDVSLGAGAAGAPLFAEETEAQTRLAARGYRGLYAGDVRVEHVVSPDRVRLREVLRRRFWAGVSMRMIGQWSFLDGLGRVLAGVAETPIAFLLRRHAAMAGGIARLGAGTGVLVAPIVRRRLRRGGPG